MTAPTGSGGVLAVLRNAAYELHNYHVGAPQPMDEAIQTVEAMAREAQNAEAIIRNCVSAGQIGAGYLQHADDIRDCLARFHGGA